MVHHVALREESVDRNSKFGVEVILALVALREESVDRNRQATLVVPLPIRRSPR